MRSPFKVRLTSVGNPDHGQNPNRPVFGVPTRTAAAKSYKHASELCRQYIELHDLGMGNWTGGAITDQTGQQVAKVSYNGRIWDMDGKEISREQ